MLAIFLILVQMFNFNDFGRESESECLGEMNWVRTNRFALRFNSFKCSSPQKIDFGRSPIRFSSSHKDSISWRPSNTWFSMAPTRADVTSKNLNRQFKAMWHKCDICHVSRSVRMGCVVTTWVMSRHESCHMTQKTVCFWRLSIDWTTQTWW